MAGRPYARSRRRGGGDIRHRNRVPIPGLLHSAVGHPQTHHKLTSWMERVDLPHSAQCRNARPAFRIETPPASISSSHFQERVKVWSD